MKYLLEKLQDICNELNDEDEIAIIKKYGNDSKRMTFAISCKIFDIYCMIQSEINYGDIGYTIKLFYEIFHLNNSYRNIYKRNN
jgi:hypothetical protein